MAARFTRTGTIADSASLSGEIDIGSKLVVGIQTPASLEGAAMTFQGAPRKGGTYENVYDSDNNELSVAIGSNRSIGLTPTEMDVLAAFGAIKVRTGTAAAPQAQTGAATITVILK